MAFSWSAAADANIGIAKAALTARPITRFFVNIVISKDNFKNEE
jgi:hypothetical protein